MARSKSNSSRNNNHDAGTNSNNNSDNNNNNDAINDKNSIANHDNTHQDPIRRIRHNSRYRNLVDDFLLEIGRTTPLDECLNDAGVCAFAYDGHCFVIEVPEHSGLYLFYTSLGKLNDIRAKHNNNNNNNNNNNIGNKNESNNNSNNKINNSNNQKDILQTLLHWNYLQKQTRGGVLSLDDAAHNNEVTFSYYGKVEDLNCADFRTELERFVETSLGLYDKLYNKEENLKGDGEDVRGRVDFGYRF